MDLSSYLETVRNGVTSAAALGDEATRQVAERLGGAVESSTRLALIRALSDAAAQVSADVAPASVELRMNGADPELVVVAAAPSAEPTLLLPDPYNATGADDGTEPEPDEAPEPDDEPVARISLRLPASVKAQVDEKADRDGISTNAWLLRAVMDALKDRPQPPQPPAPPGPPNPPHFPSGNGPFGPYGVFGPNGPFGPVGLFGSRGQRHDGPAGGSSRRGTVQGWVR